MPLVEFQVEDGITDEEVIDLLKQKSEPQTDLNSEGQQWIEERDGNSQSLGLDYDYINIENNRTYDHLERNVGHTADPFATTMITFEEADQDYRPLRVNRTSLKQMKSSEVIVVEFPPPLTKKYYRNVMPDIQITVCPSCLKVWQLNIVVIRNIHLFLSISI